MTPFQFPEVVTIEVKGDPDYVTGGFGIYPGMHWDERIQSLVVHWHEGHERTSVVDFQLGETADALFWKAEGSGEFIMRAMTLEIWRERFVPKGWRDVDSLAELGSFLRNAL